MSRSKLSDLDGSVFDVAIVGAGINGASAAQHLAAAGYKVLIVDKGDFASGASSRSSRLLHCGLRYLAPGRSMLDFVAHPSRLRAALRMARQAMQARSEFVGTSPSRARAIRLHFPIYRDGAYARWQIDIAFRLLKLIGPKDVSLDYRLYDPDAARALPLVRHLRDFDRLVGVAGFREYQFNWPERAALDAIIDAERMGAVVRNYTTANLTRHATDGWQIELVDALQSATPVTVRAETVLNMAGAWIDQINRVSPRAARRVFGTKGAHIVVKLPEECRGLGIATLNSKTEPFYCVPWGDLHYFGPTETPYEGDLDDIHATGEERDWLVGEANRMLPSLNLRTSDIRLSWAGVRPLTYDENVPFGNRARVIHDLARDGLPDAYAMTAGPVMTHRLAAREIVETVARRHPPHGPRQQPDYARGEPGNAGLEHATNLADVLFRRRGTAWSGATDHAVLERTARDLGETLGWDESRRTQEIARFQQEWDRLFQPAAA